MNTDPGLMDPANPWHWYVWTPEGDRTETQLCPTLERAKAEAIASAVRLGVLPAKLANWREIDTQTLEMFK